MNFILIQRDVKLALQAKGDWLLGLSFFAIFLALAVIALGGDSAILQRLAPAVVWLALLMSAMLSFGQIFQSDYDDGTLAQLILFRGRVTEIVLSKFASYILIALLPLWIATPLAGLMLNLSAETLAGLMLAILFGIPAIAAYGVFSSALTVSRGAGGVLIILVCAPFLIPVLIFGISAVEIYPVQGLWSAPFKALFGLSLIGCIIAIPAASAAIRTGFE